MLWQPLVEFAYQGPAFPTKSPLSPSGEPVGLVWDFHQLKPLDTVYSGDEEQMCLQIAV